MLKNKKLLILGGSRISCEIIHKARELGVYTGVTDWYEYEKSPSQVFYNGQLVQFDVAAVIEEDRTLIPLRGLLEKMGAVVEWDEKNKTAVVTKDDTTLSVKINHYGVKVNEQYKYMDVPARLVDGRTMVPLRFLSEELGFKVDWNERTSDIIISQ